MIFIHIYEFRVYEVTDVYDKVREFNGSIAQLVELRTFNA